MTTEKPPRKLYKCEKCRYVWLSPITPKYCADCHNPNWNVKTITKDPISEPGEIWKDMEMCFSMYKISNLGKIYCVKSGAQRKISRGFILLPVRMFPSNEKRMKNFSIKHLLAQYFPPNN